MGGLYLLVLVIGGVTTKLIHLIHIFLLFQFKEANAFQKWSIHIFFKQMAVKLLK